MHIPTAVFRFRPTIETARDFIRGMNDDEWWLFRNEVALSPEEEKLFTAALASLPEHERNIPRHVSMDPDEEDLEILARIAKHSVHNATLHAIAHGMQYPDYLERDIIPYLQEEGNQERTIRLLREFAASTIPCHA